MLNQLTIWQLAAKLARREVSARQAMQACLDQIQRVDGRLRAFLSCDAATPSPRPTRPTRPWPRGATGRPLLGVPIAIKDVIAVRGQPLSCGSKILGQFHFALQRHGRGKIAGGRRGRFWTAEHGRVRHGQLHGEFGLRRDAQSVGHRPHSRRFFRRFRRGGGGGRMPRRAGSDTGGSIRQPAALCGCVGLKPTYGRVSRYGLVAFASSLDQIGPFTKDVRDAALVLGAISGLDPRDSTSVPQPVPDYAAALDGDIKGLKLGLAKEYMIGGLDPEVERGRAGRRANNSKNLARKSSKFPCRTPITPWPPITSSPPPRPAPTWPASTASATARGWTAPTRSSFTARRAARVSAPEVKRRIILGTYVLSSGYYDAYYLRAQKVRTLIRSDFLNAFEKVDAIVTPTSPDGRPSRLAKNPDDPLQMYLSDIFTISCNLAGICGMSLPCGFTAESQTAHRPAIAGQALWRGNHLETRPRLRAEHRLAQGKTAAVVLNYPFNLGWRRASNSAFSGSQ